MQDIFDLINDFLSNGGKLTITEIRDVCDKILGLLEKKEGVIKKENKHSLFAERLPEPIVLRELKVN